MATRLTLCTVAALAALLSSCGSPKPAPQPGLFEAGSPHANACKSLLSQRAKEVASKRYLPNELLIHRWPTQTGAAAKGPTLVDEAALTQRVLSAKARGTLIIARGGTGKSKLAWSLEAQLCGQIPVVRVDLQWDVKPPQHGENPVLTAALHAVHGRSADPAAALQRALGNKPWLLLLDSLDEVPLDRRKRLVAHVNAAMKRFPTLRTVVFTRPPVFTGNYGLQHAEALVELPQLSCARTDDARARLIQSDSARATFNAFTKRYGLDRKAVGAADRCYYPHLSTYRDFFVVKRISQAGTQGAQLASRAHVYGFYLTVLLVKDLQGVGVLPKDALTTIDRMVQAQRPTPATRNLRFALPDCEASLPVADAAKKRGACERLMQSSLFTADTKPGTFRLRNQSLADLFFARHTAALVAKDGCDVVQRRSALFESNEVAGFFVGLAEGQRCLAQLTQTLCAHGGFAQHNYEQLDQGLPGGAKRLAVIRQAQAAKGQEPDLCVTALLDRLHKAARGDQGAQQAPDQTPAPALPGQ